MKTLLLILLIAPAICYAQTEDYPFEKNSVQIDSATNQISYRFTDTIGRRTKDQLFSKAMEWIALNFKSANDVIKLQDREGGKIIVKGLSRESYGFKLLGMNSAAGYTQHFTMDMTIRDGKYRVVLTDFVSVTDVRSTSSTSVPSETFTAEKSYSLIPSSYNFQKLNSGEKRRLNTHKQFLANNKKFSQSTFESIKIFMRNGTPSYLKKDDF